MRAHAIEANLLINFASPGSRLKVGGRGELPVSWSWFESTSKASGGSCTREGITPGTSAA